MSDIGDLKKLLDRLKTEVDAQPQEKTGSELPGRVAPASAPVPAHVPVHSPAHVSVHSPPRPAAEAARREPYRPYKLHEPRIDPKDVSLNSAWVENKEAILFGMLASLIISLGGILAGMDYLVFIGAVVFVCFSAVMCLALAKYCVLSRRHELENQGTAARLDALSKRVEMLSERAASGGAPQLQSGAAPDREMEQKVEELRVLVKSLAKVVESGNK